MTYNDPCIIYVHLTSLSILEFSLLLLPLLFPLPLLRFTDYLQELRLDPPIELLALLHPLPELIVWHLLCLLLNDHEHLIAYLRHEIVHKPAGCVLELRVCIEDLDVPGRVVVDSLEVVVTSFYFDANMAVGGGWERDPEIST